MTAPPSLPSPLAAGQASDSAHQLALPPELDERQVFRALFGAYPDALLMVDAQGTIVLANPTADTLFGYAAGELVGLPVDTLVPDPIRPRHAAYRQAYAHQPRARPMGTDMNLVAKRRDGSEVMVEIALSPLQQSDLPFVVVAIRGIGEYPRVKQALQRARYAESVATMGRLAVDTRDPQALLQQVPVVAADALQVDSAVVLLLAADGASCQLAAGIALLPGEAIGEHVPSGAGTALGHALAAGGPFVVADGREAQRFGVPEAERAAGITSSLTVPLSDRGRTIGLLSVRSRQPQRFGDDEVRFLASLSHLLAATLQRLQTEETLNHAQRLESVGQLTGGIAHDFNNLLTVIQGNLQVLEEQPGIAGNPAALALVGAAARASRRGADLTGKLLAFSRRQVLSPSRVDASALLQSLADMLRRTLDRRIRIEVDVGADTARPCPPCHADAGQLESALLNIAINARDAMPGGGWLRFACAPCDPLPDGLLTEFGPDLETAHGFVSIAIADTGAGMTDAVRERAFEPFFTTKELGRGTGLGLSTVYGFVKQSHGAIGLTSEPGAGTTVTLYLPRHVAATARSTDDADAPDVLPDGLRVWLVEDETEVRAVALHFLQALNAEVQAFGSGEEALAALDASPASAIDLLLTDIALGPGVQGTELAQTLQASRPEIAVLLMSGYSDELLALSESAPLSWELLAKPYSREALQSAMVRALASRTAP